VAVCGEADDGEDDAVGIGFVVGGGADVEEFRSDARVDVVAGGGAGVSGEDCEVAACYAKGGAAVVGIAGDVKGMGRDGEGGALTGRSGVGVVRWLWLEWRRRSSLVDRKGGRWLGRGMP
jgi:hypothetical protein